jgi:hypothetical protein
MRSSGGSAIARADKLRLRWLSAVVAVMALLTIGWPLVSLAIANRRELAALSTLTIGPSQADLAKFTVGPGWSMIPTQTDPRLDYALRRGAVDLTITYVSLLDHAPDPHLWAGLQQILQISHPGVRLGRPSGFTTVHGSKGASAALTSAADIGTATVVRSPTGNYAIEMILIAPRHSNRLNLETAHRILRSLQLLAPGR